MRLYPVCALLVAVLAANPVLARNIMTEQKEAAEARDAHRDAVNQLQEIQQKIDNQKLVIQREQDRLKALQAEESKARTEITRTQQEMDKKAKILEDAWQQRQNY